ncbi:MAG TPA: DEAD/DEAH box helicase family protein [Chitinophagales bacterium]|nr:DEAD/DEAH box helicase family protein [Chitinophagales bacterium]
MISLKPYQETKVAELVKAVSDLIYLEAINKICVFQSPTGSGKTVMMAKFIEEIIKELSDTDFCFLWVSIGKGELHKQSKRSLDSIFDGFPYCVLVEDEFLGSRNIIEQNEVVVVNWEKLRSKKDGEWKNKIMRDGEGINFIEVLEATKEKRKIILIIDESHFASDTERTNELRQIVNADVTIEMSATPKIQPTLQDLAAGSMKMVHVDSKDVIESGMIKKELIINEGLKEIVSDEKTSQDIILEAAFSKRNELKKTFEEKGAKINPLCLIQLPNAEAGEAKKEIVEAFLASKGITESNGKLAIWLSDDKSDFLDEISHPDNQVEFLIFKQAIDTGWDCPRAHILVKLREISSYTFEIQTVGRILRMPEQKHYDNDILNKGYIYTNLQSVVIRKEEYNPNIIKHLKSTRKDIYKNIDLESYYKSRVDFGDITSSFYDVLEKVLCESFQLDLAPALVNTVQNSEKLKKLGIDLSAKTHSDGIIVDKVLEAKRFDSLQGHVEGIPETIKAKLSDNDIYDLFNQIIKENLNGFAPKRSIPTVREALYVWFRHYLGINPRSENGAIKIQIIFLQNHQKFSRILSEATNVYKPFKKDEVKKKIEEQFYKWNIPSEAYFNQFTDEKQDYRLNVYEPCYFSITRSNPEKEFEKHLESLSNKIEWWYKNGEESKEYYGIKYIENGMPQTFYPDFIILNNNGTLGIFDTKAGQTAKDAGLKSEALQKYIKDQNKKGKKLSGGILIKDNTNKWRVNRKEKYSYDLNDLRDWDYFDDI